MIKRQYFYSIKWNHLDGKQSYSFTCGIFTRTSLFSDPIAAYKWVTDDYENKMIKEFPNGTIETVAFNRV